MCTSVCKVDGCTIVRALAQLGDKLDEAATHLQCSASTTGSSTGAHHCAM